MLLALVWTAPSQAQASCDSKATFTLYEMGHRALSRGKVEEALTLWRPLAERGFAPAQSRLGRALADAGDPAEATFWLALAAGRWESGARLTLMETAGRLGPEERRTAFAEAATWRPRAGCGTAEAIMPEIRAPGTLGTRLARVLDHLPSGALGHVAAIEVEDRRGGVLSGRTGTDGVPVMTVPKAYLELDDDEALAKALAYHGARLIYARLPGVRAAERFLVHHHGVDLIGSPHPDVDNAPFFDQMAEALDRAADLPEGPRRAVEAITEIRYDPPSRFKARDLGVRHRSFGAYYRVQADPEARRPVTIVKNLGLYGAGLVDLVDLVHEGTHAAQDLEIHRKRFEREALGLEIERLAREGAPDLPALRQRFRALDTLIALWEKRGDFDPAANTQAFECEASLNEVKAAQFLGLGRSHAGAYGSVCEAVREQLDHLRDDAVAPVVRR